MRQHLTTTSKLSKAAGVLFMAALSVYIEQAPSANPSAPVIPAAPASPASPETEAVFAAPAIPAAQAAAATPAAAENAAPQAGLSESAASSPLLDNVAPTTQPAFTVSDAAPTTQPVAGAAVAPEAVAVAPDRPANPVAPTDVNVSPDSGTAELHVNDASRVEVLKMISMQSQKNIVASKEVHGTITANLYDVTIPEALDALLTANGYAYKEKGNFIYVYTKKELVEM